MTSHHIKAKSATPSSKQDLGRNHSNTILKLTVFGKQAGINYNGVLTDLKIYFPIEDMSAKENTK